MVIKQVWLRENNSNTFWLAESVDRHPRFEGLAIGLAEARFDDGIHYLQSAPNGCRILIHPEAAFLYTAVDNDGFGVLKEDNDVIGRWVPRYLNGTVIGLEHVIHTEGEEVNSW